VGEEVFGKVVEILPDAIFIDLSSKAKAIFDRHELTGDLPQPGDQFIAQVHGDGSRGGMVVLTNNPQREETAKAAVLAASESGELVNALVTGVIKGGVELDSDGLRAFAPGSHVDLKLGADLSYLIGQRHPFKVVKYAKNGKEVVLSRREQLEKDATQNRQEGLAKLQVGSVVDAFVRSIVEWGVFVAIPSANGIEGLIHVSEASYERNAKLSDLFKVGQKTEVKVLRIDEKGKLWLSRKAVAGDPWETATANLTVGTRLTGRIARMQPFGVFVELQPGIDGLIRTSDLSLRRINDPSEVAAVGDNIDVVVVHVDSKQRKIALHPALSGDTEEVRQKVAPYRSVMVEVVSAEPSGLAVRILGVTGAAARGFIPAGHTNTARGTDLRREFPVGSQLEAKIIEMDPKRGEIKLSIRALKEDSEKAAYNEYRTKVARESKFGTFGDIFAKRRGE
jgi:small subunit ribosomal protein S1